MTKRKKVGIVIAVIAVLFIIFNLVLMGLLGGMGPLGFLQQNRIKALPGNAENYRPETVEAMENSPLQGETICFLGSSVTHGSAALGNSMADYLGRRFDCTIVKEAVSGTTLVDNGSKSYIQRLQNNLDPDAVFSLLVCQLSTNDATKDKPLGQIADGMNLTDFDTSTVAGAMEYVICYSKETWGCPVMFYTGSRYDSNQYAAMVALLPALQEKWGIGIIDLWSDDTFNQISDEERGLYMNDGIHPTMAGYKEWWVPEMEEQILAFIKP